MAKPVNNLYELVPEQKRSFCRLEDGTVEVLIPRYGSGPVGRLLKNVFNRRPIRIHLDDVGTRVWLLCDGSRSFFDIGESLHEEFGERIEPVYDRLETFLKQMVKAGLVEWKK